MVFIFLVTECSYSRGLAPFSSRYIGWIDIAQVVNERFLQLFLGCLTSSDELLVRQSCSCILEVVNKVMTTLRDAICVDRYLFTHVW